jgi:hypothetical protein
MFIEKDCGTIIERVLNVGTGAEKEEKEKVDAETQRGHAVARVISFCSEELTLTLFSSSTRTFALWACSISFRHIFT